MLKREQDHLDKPIASAGVIESQDGPPPSWRERIGQSPRLRFALASVSDQVLVSGSNLVLNIVLARWLSKEGYGWFGVLFSAFVLFSGFFTACLIEPLSIFGAVWFRLHLGAYTRRVVELHLLLCLVIAPAVFLFLDWTAPPGVPISASAIAVLLCMVFVVLYWILRRVVYVTADYEAAVTAGLVYNLFLLGCIAVLYALGRLSPPAGLCSQAGGAAFAALLLLRGLRSWTPGLTAPLSLGSVARVHWEYGRWALGTAVAYWLSGEAYYVIVGKLVGAPAVAGLRSVQNLSMLFPNFVTAMSVLLLPRLVERFAAEGGPALRRPVHLFTAAAAAAAVAYGGVLWLLGAPLLAALYGKGYAEYAHLFPALVCNVVLIAASQGVQTGLRAMNAPREIFSGFVLASLFTCTAGVAMTYAWQLTGAVAGLCCSTLLFLCYVLSRYHSLSGLPRV